MRVHCADEAGIVGAADMTDIDGIGRIRNRRADQRLLDRAAISGDAPRPDIPCRRGDDLIVLDLAALDLDPMAERAANSFRRAPAAAVFFARLDIPWVFQFELAQA